MSAALEEEIAMRTAPLLEEWTGKVLDAGPGDIECERGKLARDDSERAPDRPCDPHHAQWQSDGNVYIHVGGRIGGTGYDERRR